MMRYGRQYHEQLEELIVLLVEQDGNDNGC